MPASLILPTPTGKHRKSCESLQSMVGNMLTRRKSYLLLCTLLFHISHQVRYSHQANGAQQHPEQAGLSNSPQIKSISAANSSNSPKTSLSNEQQQQPLEDILKDTFMLLDVLDQKLASVSNKTPSALMRDNLRALDEDFKQAGSNNEDNYDLPSLVRRHPEFARLNDEASIEEALVRLAGGFSPSRKSTEASELQPSQLVDPAEPMFAAASNQERSLPLVVSAANQSESPASHLDSPNGQTTAPSTSTTDYKKTSRQLLDDNQLTSDSTERHIKFTLDLMQSIFASQSYSSKTNSIESFLISPLSIQVVLMMMHLGSRGQTRREIGNCLHLNIAPTNQQLPASKVIQDRSTGYPNEPMATSSAEPSGASMTSKLKRRFQATSGLADSGKNGATVKSTTTRPQQHINSAPIQQQQAVGNNAHELFGSAMRNLLKDPIVTRALTSANQIFLQKNLPLSSQYDSAIKHYYAADVKQVDFQHQTTGGHPSSGSLANDSKSKLDQSTFSNASLYNSTSGDNGNDIQQMINDWIERQTKGRISNFLTGPISTSTLMMAINVLHFKGDWQYKFDPTDTQPEAWFTQANGKTVKMPMMCARLPVAFAHDPIMKTSVIELPYKAQRLGLFLLLPDEISGIFHTMQMLNSTSFANLISSMRKSSATAEQGSNGIDVRIPRFSIESSPRLSHILSQQLGLKSLFSPDVADLSGMFAPSPVSFKARLNSGNASNQVNYEQQASNNQLGVPPQVGLDELIHKAVLQVDEQGSVAAASSATIVERVGLFTGNYFEADHPFLLFLMDKRTGLVLFSGAFAGGSAGQSNINSSNQETQKQRQKQQ